MYNLLKEKKNKAIEGLNSVGLKHYEVYHDSDGEEEESITITAWDGHSGIFEIYFAKNGIFSIKRGKDYIFKGFINNNKSVNIDSIINVIIMLLGEYEDEI